MKRIYESFRTLVVFIALGLIYSLAVVINKNLGGLIVIMNNDNFCRCKDITPEGSDRK